MSENILNLSVVREYKIDDLDHSDVDEGIKKKEMIDPTICDDHIGVGLHTRAASV